jgi:hypothetical protein
VQQHDRLTVRVAFLAVFEGSGGGVDSFHGDPFGD